MTAIGWAAGDRVRITSREHPWYGSTGTISAPFSSEADPGLKWTVALDAVWGDTAVAENEIRRAGR